MKRGPRPGIQNGDDRNMFEKAVEAWAGDQPDWVEELALLADREGLKAAGKAISYSPAVVSEVLRKKYAGDIERVTEKVRGALMGVVVECPILGEITRDLCLDHQKAPYAATNSLRPKLYRACRGPCPHSRLKGGGDGTQ